MIILINVTVILIAGLVALDLWVAAQETLSERSINEATNN